MSEDALRAARESAVSIDPARAAERCGAAFVVDDGAASFRLAFLDATENVSYPEFKFGEASRLPPHVQALLVYYLGRSEGAVPTGTWRSFVDLPGGSFYWRAFQGYTGDALSRRLGPRSDGLDQAIAALGGRALSAEEIATNADHAWVVPALPRVPVVVVWWDADDEFGSRAELLFDETATSHLPLDGCAVLGSWLTSRLAGLVETERASG